MQVGGLAHGSCHELHQKHDGHGSTEQCRQQFVESISSNISQQILCSKLSGLCVSRGPSNCSKRYSRCSTPEFSSPPSLRRGWSLFAKRPQCRPLSRPRCRFPHTCAPASAHASRPSLPASARTLESHRMHLQLRRAPTLMEARYLGPPQPCVSLLAPQLISHGREQEVLLSGYQRTKSVSQ